MNWPLVIAGSVGVLGGLVHYYVAARSLGWLDGWQEAWGIVAGHGDPEKVRVQIRGRWYRLTKEE